jgi:hypothetical protein
MNKKLITVVIVIILALVGIIYFTSHKSTVVGATSNTTNLAAASLAVGSGCDNSESTCTGTILNQVNAGFCYIQAYATTIAASSTAKVDCQGTAAVGGITTATNTPLTGVLAGDKVTGTLATSTSGTTFLGLDLVGMSASSTAGYIQLILSNDTGATFTWPTTGTATGTVSYIDWR